MGRLQAMTPSEQRTKRRQLREETRREILDEAQVFLREQPFRELSVDALMARTGHSRTVFYRHFEDVSGLVLELISEVGRELVEVGGKWADAQQTTPEEAHKRLGYFVDFYVRNGPLVHAVAEAAHHDDDVEEAYGGLIEGFVALTTSAIEARVARGEMEPVDAPEIARALVRMLNGYLDDSLGRGRDIDPERVLNTVSTIWSRTLFPAA